MPIAAIMIMTMMIPTNAVLAIALRSVNLFKRTLFSKLIRVFLDACHTAFNPQWKLLT